MWPIPDFLMTVWTAQIRFFQIRPRPLSYVVLNRIHIRCFAMRLQSERPCRISCDFYIIEMWQTSQFCAGGGGKIKITMADNIKTILSLRFRLRLHINLKIAKHTLTRAASIFISANTMHCVWRHVFCACGSLQGLIQFTHETDGSRI